MRTSTITIMKYVVGAATLMLAAETFCQQAEEQLVQYRQLVTPEALERLANDLSLSDDQRAAVRHAHAEYLKTLDDFRHKCEKHTRAQIAALQNKHMPELDPSVDLNHLDAARRMLVMTAREKQARGEDPLQADQKYVAEVNLVSAKNIENLNTYELSTRDEFLEKVLPILADVQMQCTPRSLYRLEINAYAFAPVNKSVSNDPILRIDLMRILKDATATEAELAPWKDIVEAPFAQGKSPGEVAVRLAIERYEAAAAANIQQIERSYGRAMRRFYEALQVNDTGQAANARRLCCAQMREAFALRESFAVEIADLAGDLIGEEAAKEWMYRIREETCPNLYARDSVDMMVDWVLDQNTRHDEHSRSAINDVYNSYVIWRDAMREKLHALEIEEFVSLRLTWDRQTFRPGLALEQLNQERRSMAKKARAELRSQLDPELQERFVIEEAQVIDRTRIASDVIP
jgi:hypothetical protein